MPRFKLVIEYTGTRYSGWQIQKNARTVAGEIDAAAREVTGRRDFELYGSGRTDAGVHASGQVAHLDVATSLPADVLRRRLNDDLPADINILSAGVVPHRFHARHDATGRTYLYQIARRRTAFAKPYVWWVREPLDLGAMREAAGALLGLRDFKAFAVTEDDDRDRRDGRSRSTHVLVERLDIIEQGSLVLLRVEGSHFLWRMVRRMVGVLAAVGRGELDAAEVPVLLVSESAQVARLTAPASGLFLARVTYPGDTREMDVSAITPVP